MDTLAETGQSGVADHGAAVFAASATTPSESDPLAEDIAALAAAGLFDAPWYLETYPDVAAAHGDALAHFGHWGWAEGRSPNPWFDTEWYLQCNTDVTAAGINPLLHYAHWGEAEGRRPSPDFDPAWYRAHHQPPPGGTALAPYLAHRRDGSATPVPWFDAGWYLAQNPDVAAAGADPFEHYLTSGTAEARTPRPDATILRGSQLFDGNFYLIAGPDVRETGRDPLDHFCTDGWHEGRKPNAYFDPPWYIARHLAGVPRPVNPLVHYVLWGEAMDLKPILWFDTGWYRRRYGLTPGTSPLAHYLQHRRGQAHSPTPHFDVDFYMAQYGHLVGTNRDPFAHYLRHGSTEDLNPAATFDAAAYRRRFMGRASRHFSESMPLSRQNPLVHFLSCEQA